MKVFLSILIFLPLVVSGGGRNIGISHSKNIIFIGDSITYNATENGDWSNPPGVSPGSWIYEMWKDSSDEKPLYYRYDSGIFLQSGGWIEATYGNYPKWWSDYYGRRVNAMYSSGANSNVKFAVDPGEYSFIYRTVVNGGVGRLQSLPSVIFLCDAHLNATIPAKNECAIDYRSNGFNNNTEYWKTVDFTVLEKSEITLSGSGTITYCGIERRSENSGYRFVNAARAGHNVSELSAFFETDVLPYADENSVIVWQLPLINEISDQRTLTQMYGAIAAYRQMLLSTGAKNIFVIVPHYRDSYGGGDSVLYNGYTAAKIYDFAKSQIASYGVPVLDMREIIADGMTYDGTHYNGVGIDTCAKSVKSFIGNAIR